MLNFIIIIIIIIGSRRQRRSIESTWKCPRREALDHSAWMPKGYRRRSAVSTISTGGLQGASAPAGVEAGTGSNRRDLGKCTMSQSMIVKSHHMTEQWVITSWWWCPGHREDCWWWQWPRCFWQNHTSVFQGSYAGNVHGRPQASV